LPRSDHFPRVRGIQELTSGRGEAAIYDQVRFKHYLYTYDKKTREKTNTIYAKGDFDIFSLRILFAHLFNPFIAQFVLLMMHADLASALSLSSICAVLGVTGLSGHP
jgi:hypothetical protein